MGRKESSCSRQNKRVFSYVLNLCPECLADTYHETSQTYSTLIVQILYLTSVPYALIPVALALLYTICLEGSSVYEEVCFTCRLSSNFLPWGFGVYFFCSFLQRACQTWDADPVNYSSGEKWALSIWVQTCKYLSHMIKINAWLPY